MDAPVKDRIDYYNSASYEIAAEKMYLREERRHASDSDA